MTSSIDSLTENGAPDREAPDHLLQALSEHYDLLEYFERIKFDRVSALGFLARESRADAGPRAVRRLSDLPSDTELGRWHLTLTTALNTLTSEVMSRAIAAFMLDGYRGKIDNPRLIVETFVISIVDARIGPQILSGAVKRAWLALKIRPTIPVFMPLCLAHRKETQTGLDLVVRTMAIRRDAEIVVRRRDVESGHLADRRHA